MISVSQALEIIQNHAPKAEAENVPLEDALNRVLAEDLVAQIDIPPFATSNMDGYAIGLTEAEKSLTVIGESSAGRPFQGTLAKNEAARIFTGAIVPHGAVRVILQEDAKLDGKRLSFRSSTTSVTHIRQIGSDFASGETLLKAGHTLRAGDLVVAATSNKTVLSVRRRFRVAIIETGNELRPAAATLQPGQVVASSGYGLSSLLSDWGADLTIRSIAQDTPESLEQMIKESRDCDIIVTIGGASVGDYDLVRSTASTQGFNIEFSNVALKPGKPCWFGTRKNQIILGLPGNPASTFVCAHLFLRPLLGLENPIVSLPISANIEENGPREVYLRAIARIVDGQLTATPLSKQDSYLTLPQSRANVLIRVPPMGGPYRAGDALDVMRLSGGPDIW